MFQAEEKLVLVPLYDQGEIISRVHPAININLRPPYWQNRNRNE